MGSGCSGEFWLWSCIWRNVDGCRIPAVASAAGMGGSPTELWGFGTVIGIVSGGKSGPRAPKQLNNGRPGEGEQWQLLVAAIL